MPLRLMHLSDLHLGNDLVWRSLKALRSWRCPAKKEVTRGLATAIRDLNPDYVILSGDIVNKPSSKIYREQADYLRALFKDAFFDFERRLLIVPGNHDASMLPVKNPEESKRLGPYRDFLKDLYGESDVETRRIRYTRVDTGRKLIFACLDSTLKSQAPLAEGEIGKSQLKWLREKLAAINRQLGPEANEYTRVAVLHHHVVPIKGAGGAEERFMQLVDAGDLLPILDEFRFHFVLHGHKHVPHIFQRPRSDASFMSVIGAGTATCPIVAEQHRQGNTFNLIDLWPDENRFRNVVYKANTEGEFKAARDEDRDYPFRLVHLGYSTARSRKIVTVESDGTTHIRMRREEIRLDDGARQLLYIPVGVAAGSPQAEIVKFSPDETHATMKVELNTPTRISGAFHFRKPPSPGAPVPYVEYTYSIKNGTAMSRRHFDSLYPKSDKPRESVSLTVVTPTDSMELEVQLPFEFQMTADPVIEIEQGGHIFDLSSFDYRVKVDRVARRCEVVVRNAPLSHTISILWDLPQ